MRASDFTQEEKHLVNDLVSHFTQNLELFSRLEVSLRTLFYDNKTLRPLVHSLKSRVKEPSHLKDKLFRKIIRCKEENTSFNINKDNLFSVVNDLAGIRILHLHTSQIADIKHHISSLLDEQLYKVVEGPFARAWDDEYKTYFKSIGIESRPSDALYTSVHYVVEPNSKTKITAEIQVRTLAEELWGEVAHSINYPHPTKNIACAEQIKVLARITSSCTRLVDSIYATNKLKMVTRGKRRNKK